MKGINRKALKAVSIWLALMIATTTLSAMAGEITPAQEESTVVLSPVEIGEEIASLDEVTVVEEIVSSVDTEEEEGIIIGLDDNEVPLSSLPFIKEQKKRMPWVWAIVVGLLGSAGYEFYMQVLRKNREEN